MYKMIVAARKGTTQHCVEILLADIGEFEHSIRPQTFPANALNHPIAHAVRLATRDIEKEFESTKILGAVRAALCRHELFIQTFARPPVRARGLLSCGCGLVAKLAAKIAARRASWPVRMKRPLSCSTYFLISSSLNHVFGSKKANIMLIHSLQVMLGREQY